MKKNNKARRKLRNNPVHALPGIGKKMIGNAVGPLMIREALGDATLPEIAVTAALIPMFLNVLRSMGPEAAKAFAKLYPIPEDEETVPADGADPAHSASPEAKQ